MSDLYRVGDMVKTRYGFGRVVGRKCWADMIVDMSDVDARVFSKDVQARYGLEYRKRYQNLHVELSRPLLDGSRYKWLESKEVEADEGKVIETEEVGP